MKIHEMKTHDGFMSAMFRSNASVSLWRLLELLSKLNIEKVHLSHGDEIYWHAMIRENDLEVRWVARRLL